MPRFQLRNIVRNAKRDVNDELRFHLDMRTEELVAQGMSREDARRRAAESFGDVESIEAECTVVREERGRAQRRREWWSDARSDVRYALRTLRRSPLFAITAVLTFALGVAGAVAGFTLVNGVLLRPLPYHDPQQLAMVWMQGESNGKLETQWPLSIANFIDIADRARSLSGIAAFRAWPYTLRGEGAGATSEIVPSARVSSSLFDVLGVKPILGRDFVADDANSGSERVVVIGHDLWQRRFNGSSDVVGRRISLSGEEVTVIGVMPSGFAFPRGSELPGGLQFPARTELWTPLVVTELDLTRRGTANIAAIARVKAGMSLDGAQADLAAVVSQLVTEYPRYFAPRAGVSLTTVAEQAAAPVRRGLWLLMGAVTVVLLIAMVNIANLLTARASDREHEIAVRRALGASRMRVLRQLATENVLLAGLGALLGFVIAMVGTRALITRLPAGLPRADDVVIDWRVVVLTMLLTLVAAMIFGGVSALHASGERADVVRGGVRATASRRRRKGRRLLVVTEVALSIVLLISAGLLMRSYLQLARVSPGFDSNGAMTASVVLPIGGSFDQQGEGPRWAAFFEEYERLLVADPAIAAAGGISSQPLSGAYEATNFVVEGASPIPEGMPVPSADYQVATPGWFDAARVPLLAGRTFDSRDRRDGDNVVMVSETMARAGWPGLSLPEIVGKRIATGLMRAPHTVVGVVGDIRQSGLDIAVRPMFYLPEAQFPYPFLSFVVRGAPGSTATSVLPAMRRALKGIDPSLALDRIRPFDDVVAASIARQRFGMLLTGVFAAVALFLATVGLYGVIATGIAQRRHEIGVRMALGDSEQRLDGNDEGRRPSYHRRCRDRCGRLAGSDATLP